MATDPHAALRDHVLRTVLEGPGVTEPSLRKSAAEGKNLPVELQPLVEKIHQHAYRVTDDDIARLKSTYDDDQLFEIIVSASLGASRQRLLAGLAALENA
jgi:hypothetical protein